MHEFDRPVAAALSVVCLAAANRHRIRWAVNYYQSGWGAPLTAEPGFRGKLSNVDVAADSSVSHISIDKSARVQAEIAREIAAVAKTNN